MKKGADDTWTSADIRSHQAQIGSHTQCDRVSKVRLGDVCEIVAGQGAPQGDAMYSASGTPFVKAGDLARLLAGCPESEVQKVTESTVRKCKLKLQPSGSLLFAKSGMSCMKGYVYRLRSNCYVVSHLAIVKPSEKICSEYLEHCLRLNKPNSLVKDPAYPSISLVDIAGLELPLHPLPAQRRIADELDQLCALKKNVGDRLAILGQIAKSLFVEMFGDPVLNTKGWPLKTLPEIGENLDGKRVPITSGDRKPGPFPYYGASGIVDHVEGYIFDEDILLISEDGANLLMRSTPIAFPAKGKTWVNNHAHVMRFDNLATQKYVECFINAISIENYVTGTAQPKLNQAKMNSIPIPLPPLELQREFLAFIEQLDKSQFTLRETIATLDQLYRAKLQEYFG